MTQFWLAVLATALVLIVALFAFEQMTGVGPAVRSWAHRHADRAYDLLLIPVARIGSASGHVSYFHVAKHYREA